MPQDYIQYNGYKIHTKWNDMDFGGTGMMGEFNMSVHTLIEKLGNPTFVNSRLIMFRWLIQFDDGTVATIYNHHDTTPGSWMIGGFTLDIVDRVKELFNV